MPSSTEHTMYPGGPPCPCPGSGSVYHHWFNEGRTAANHHLLEIEAAARKVVKWVDEGGQLAPWPNASGLNDLRRALEIE